MCFGKLSCPVQVDDFKSWVGGGFKKKHFGVGLDQFIPIFIVRNVPIGGADAPFGKHTRKELVGGAKQGTRSQEMVPLLE